MVKVKSGKGVIEDPSFLYIEWTKVDSPKKNQQLRDLIEDLDEEYFYDSPTIDSSLPWLTFYQGETLFRGIQDTFDEFTLAKVSLANNDEGKPSIKDEPFVTDFVIDDSYDNILEPLMIASLQDKRFKSYSYDDLAMYFNDSNNGILKTYAESMNISSAELPFFPSEEEVERTPSRKPKSSSSSKSSSPLDESNLMTKIALGVGAVGLIAGLSGLGVGLMNGNRTADNRNKVVYLYKEQKKVKAILDHEHKADVFGRFFISNYYSGNKKSLSAFLSSGDAKYTQPEQLKINSNLLEAIDLNDNDTFKLTYVLSVTNQEGNTETTRLTFSIKEDKKAKYGYVVVTEPISSPFFNDKNGG